MLDFRARFVVILTSYYALDRVRQDEVCDLIA